MKRRTGIIVVLLFVFNISIFAELLKDKGFIADLGWKYTNGAVLNGKKFYSVAESYREQRGVLRMANGEIEVDCWLYDTYSYHDGHGSAIYDKYLPEFFDSCNYYMVWEQETYNGDRVPIIVRNLMKQRNCDVAIYLMMGWWYVANYDKVKNTYFLNMFKIYPKS